MPERIEALIEPTLLIWARKNAGLAVPQAAKRIQVKEELLQRWEAGETRPTMNQLRKLGAVYRRPIAVFYLPEPPQDFTPLHDFRRFAGKEASISSAHLQLEIRRARDRREIALELYQDLNYEMPQPPPKVRLSDNPDTLALSIRNHLKITRAQQVEFSDDRESFNWWRFALENTGVLVFQATDVELSEMRGFSIAETPLPAVVINSKDSQRGRVFTILHEFVHIMLRLGGICDFHEAPNFPGNRKPEVFCNRVAGAILVPEDTLLLEEPVVRKKPGVEWADEEIDYLANRYRVSREVIVRRLLICNRITEDFYQRKRKQFEQEYEKLREHGHEGFVPPHRAAITSAGPSFTSLVLSSYHQKKITASDLSDFLDVKLKHIASIEHEVAGAIRPK